MAPVLFEIFSYVLKVSFPSLHKRRARDELLRRTHPRSLS